MKAALVYGLLVFLAEMTLGNPEFPVHLWAFHTLPAWRWSVPVHLFGFLWLAFWNRRLASKKMFWPILTGVYFFLAAETLNGFVFNYFEYAQQPFGGAVGSFWIVIALYAVLCAVSVHLLRR